MLLHKFNINVAIANVLLLRKSRYDLPKAKYQKFGLLKNQKKGVAHFGGSPIELGLKLLFGDSGHSIDQMSRNFSLYPSIKFSLHKINPQRCSWIEIQHYS